MSERSNPLRPTFIVKVVYDGDEWPATCDENVRHELDHALAEMQADGLIIGYEIDGPQ